MQWKEDIERLRLLCKEILGKGGIQQIEKEFGFRFREWRRSARGPFLDTIQSVLGHLQVPAAEFFAEIDKDEESQALPSWWAAFDALRFDDPFSALDEVGDCSWSGYALGLIAWQWGHYSKCLELSRDTPDALRRFRQLALAKIYSSRRSALYYSEKAAAIAAFSSMEDLASVRLERASILRCHGASTEKILKILESVVCISRSDRTLTAAWQQIAANLLDIGSRDAAAEALAKARSFDYTPRMFLGRIRWTEGRLEGATELIREAIDIFQIYFPQETALCALELASLDPKSPGIKFAKELLRANGYHHISCILEDALAKHMERYAGDIERIWRRRSLRLLQKHQVSLQEQ